ncbi:MAG: hypothetical protein WDN30_09025 [Pararobbsia sp.]
MKSRWIYAAVLVCGMSSSLAWSQNASDVEPSNDPFVQQRNAIAAANDAYKAHVSAAERVYDSKVDAASKVLDKEVEQARAERKRAIAAARANGG